jgi:hypothetical protein
LPRLFRHRSQPRSASGDNGVISVGSEGKKRDKEPAELQETARKAGEYVNLCNIMALDQMRITDGGAYSNKSLRNQMAKADAARTLYPDVNSSDLTSLSLSIENSPDSPHRRMIVRDCSSTDAMRTVGAEQFAFLSD